MAEKMITISVRLSEKDYKALIQKCQTCEPPTIPTAALRWLVHRWIKS